MQDLEKIIKWLECDYLPRVGAYRKDCKQGCDACMPMHDGDDYCDIDMLCKVLALLKEQEAVEPIPPTDESEMWRCGNCHHQIFRCTHQRFCERCGHEVKWE